VELERAVLEAVGELVLEAAAIGAPTPGGGPEQLHLFVVPRPGAAAVADEARLLSACQAAVRAQLNPLFKVERVIVVDSLPRTASNKVMRRVLRDRAASPTSPRHRM
jgi:acyl-coenzyme A synthetase/AMP-(fatty) acid ligase